MPRSLRASVFPLALLLALAFAGAAPPQPKAEATKPDKEAGSGLVPVSSPFVGHLEAAREQIRKKDWATATTLLQKLLDLDEDPLVRFKRPGKDGKDVEVVGSLRREAERLLSSLPAEGRAFYLMQYGQAAAKRLAEAKRLGDPALFAEVVRRFPYTEAEREAAERLGTLLLDRAQYETAVLCFDRLFARTETKELSPQTLFRAALAHRATGRLSRADLWKSLLNQIGEDGLTLGRRRLKLADLKKELERLRTRPSPVLREWPLFRGDPSRSAQGIGSTAVPRQLWQQQTFREKFTGNHLKEALEQLPQQKRVALPAFYPLAVTLTREDGKVPLMVYRSFWGIHAVPLCTVGSDPKSDEFVKAGDIYWEAPSTWSIDRMSRELKHTQTLTDWVQTYLNNGLRPEALFENSVVGSLSTDNVRVYAIDDFQVTPNEQPSNCPGGDRFPYPKLTDAQYHNVLQAYDLDSGKLLWDVGDREDEKNKHPLHDTFFLGPPLPLGGKLHVLTEKHGTLRLVTLDPATGQLLARPQRLAGVRRKVAEDPVRRSHAAHLASADGVLVCPTNAGAVLGVDLNGGDVLWMYSYPDNSRRTALKNAPGLKKPPPGYVYLANKKLIPDTLGRPSRPASAPIIQEGKVVFTAPDSDAVHCLRLRNGQALWTHPLQEGDLYVGGVLNGKVLIVGSKSCRALNLADGKVASTLETGIPSGMGIAAGGRYYLPLRQGSTTKQPEICILDVARGKIVAHTRFAGKEPPGNLLFFEGHVLSQTLTHVTAYPQDEPEKKRRVAPPR